MKIRYFFASAILLASCNSAVSTDELFGEYRVLKSPFEDYLIVYEDGTYLHEFTLAGQKTVVNQGDWERAEIELKQNRISFLNFISAPRSYDPQKQGIWSPLLERKKGTVALCFDVDLAAERSCFFKID